MSKQSFIVYYHYVVLGNAVIKGYSKAEAQYIMEQRMEKKGWFELVVDKVMSEKEEQAIMDSSSNPTSWKM